MKSKQPKIIVVDDNIKTNDPLLAELREHYQDVVFFPNTQATQKYIKKNLEYKMIVLLDIKLSMDYEQDNGFKTLREIRKLSSLIPIILWTTIDEISSDLRDSIGKKVFAFVEQAEDTKKIVQVIQAAEAEQNLQLATAIEEWILQRPKELQKEEPYIITTSGKSYTLKQVLKEVRLRTEFGQSMEKSILKLTINRLSRQKETLDD